ncbi:hypothetical protein E4U53_006434 [Claviceps sorghi]|nr:hypothetical protein E4U53_006434 [Claviceps sorghi]
MATGLDGTMFLEYGSQLPMVSSVDEGFLPRPRSKPLHMRRQFITREWAIYSRATQQVSANISSMSTTDQVLTRQTIGGAKQKGIIHYGVSANRQNPMSGTFHDAIFNTFRRTKGQIFYWVPPMVAAYYLMDWATERNHYLNSKHGRAEFGDEE